MISDILALIGLLMIGMFILVPVYINYHEEMIWEFVKRKMQEEQEVKKYRR